ncbi:MAG: peptidase E [Gammaproteobacteria bacterium]
MKQIIAIGGGGFGRNPQENFIEQYILDQAKSKKPNILFIPTATGELDSYIVNFYKVFSKLHCNPSHLSFFKRTPDLQKLIAAQDVVFVGGGNTKSMLAVWREWGLDKYLFEAYQKGVVMSGVSAGAICWFEHGITDSWESSLKIMPCLGFVDGICCPHYDEEPERRPATKKFLQKNNNNAVIGIEGGCALHLKDNKLYRAVRFLKNKNAYRVTTKDNQIIEAAVKSLSLVK